MVPWWREKIQTEFEQMCGQVFRAYLRLFFAKCTTSSYCANSKQKNAHVFYLTLSLFVVVGTFPNRFATVRQTLVFANTHTYANMSWIFCIFFLKLGTGFPFRRSISFHQFSSCSSVWCWGAFRGTKGEGSAFWEN